MRRRIPSYAVVVARHERTAGYLVQYITVRYGKSLAGSSFAQVAADYESTASSAASRGSWIRS